MQPQVDFFSVQTDESFIKEILNKDLLCRNDVAKINEIYQKLNCLEEEISSIILHEKQIDRIPKYNSSLVLEAIIKKIEKIGCVENIGKNPIDDVKNLVSLYHLKNFVDKELPIEMYFNNLLSKKNRKPEFDELLNDSYIHLLDHLIKMRAINNRDDRQTEIEKMTFSELAHVVLETMEAIIQKVEISIPNHCSNVLFLLGSTRAGKSTTFCFLRGDEMILKDFCYESKNDKNYLIAHDKATSCTFLPNIGIKNNLAIVDFPGFDDTNGPLISMGMECALKALVSKYQSNILVLESVTNDGGGYKAAAELGSRLERLFGNNKEQCTLGFTKYTRDPDFIRIMQIEAQQREVLLKPTENESILRGKLEMAEKLNGVEFIPQIQRELEEIQKARNNSLQQPLQENDEKERRKGNITLNETALLEQIGLNSIIRLQNLETATPFLIHNEKKIVGVNENHDLDPDHKELINTLFINDLKKKIEAFEWEFNLDFFLENIEKTSFINMICSHSNPEIGKFLHLKQINPRIVLEFDKTIAKSCVTKYMKSVTLAVDITAAYALIENLPTKTKILKEKLEKLHNYVFGLLGIPLNECNTSEKIKDKWDGIQKTKNKAGEEEKDRIRLSPGTVAGMTFSVFGIIGLIVCAANESRKGEEAEEKTIQSIIETYCIELDKMYSTLLKLKKLEELINNK